MEYIGIDVHQQESKVCILGDDGTDVLEQRVHTSRDRLAGLRGGRSPALTAV